MCRAKIDKTGLKRKYKTVIEHKMHAFAYLIHLSILYQAQLLPYKGRRYLSTFVLTIRTGKILNENYK